MLSDRNIGIIGLALAIFGTVFTIWAYVETRQLAQITYTVNHEAIYRPSKALQTGLKLPSVSTPISARVTQSVVTIWNGGNVPFKGEDTRTKLTISGDSSVDILSSETVLTKLLPGSAGFNVTGDRKSIVVDWRVFDPGEGLQIVILSMGNAASLDLSGRFLPGQAAVRGPIKSLVGSFALVLILVTALWLLVFFFGALVPLIQKFEIFSAARAVIIAVTMAFLLGTFVISSFLMLRYARSYVGDLSPIDTYLSYIDVDPKLDYRYAPM